MASELDKPQPSVLNNSRNGHPTTILPSISSLLENKNVGKPVTTLNSFNESNEIPVSVTPLPRMVADSRTNTTNMYDLSPKHEGVVHSVNCLRTESQQQAPVQFLQQMQYIPQQPIPKYRMVNNFPSNMSLEVNKNAPSANKNSLGLTVPITINKNVPMQSTNSNPCEIYKSQLSPFSQSRSFNVNTRNSSTVQLTPLSATTTVYRNNSKTGYTPVNTSFSQYQDISSNATPVNRTQFLTGKHHSESFASPQMVMNPQLSGNARGHFRSLPIIYQQPRTASLNMPAVGEISHLNIPPQQRGVSSFPQKPLMHPNHKAMIHNTAMSPQQYHHLQPQQLLHSSQQQNLHAYPQQYIQFPLQQERLPSAVYVQQGSTTARENNSTMPISLSSNGFPVSGAHPVRSQTPIMLQSSGDVNKTKDDISPKRTGSEASNNSDGYFYGYEVVEVEAETPVKRIPRPRNAFILFRQHYHRIIFKEQTEKLAHERKTVSEESKNEPSENHVDSFKLNSSVSKAIGMKWKSLSAEDRKHWCDLAEKEKAEHHLKYPDYKYIPRRKKGGKRL